MQMGDFKEQAAGALALAGVPFQEGDLDVLEVVAQVFEPAMRALDDAPLAELPFEAGLDPGGAPPAQARS
jgi:hypothetical protein